MLFIIFFLLSLTAFSPFTAYGETLPPFEPNDPYFFYNATDSELKYYPGEWYLENKAPTNWDTKKNAGYDTNVRSAWNMGYTGKGVVIGIIDDGVEGTHQDIKDNFSKALSRKFLGGEILESSGPIYMADNHGTSVAGVAAARGGNGIGGTGAAPYATIVDLRLLDDKAVTSDYINAYLWQSGLEIRNDKLVAKSKASIQIKNHSYGKAYPWKRDDESMVTAINKTAENGVIHVWAAGNERGKIDEDASRNQTHANSNVITVAALGSDGKFSDYSNYSASVFITAPSNRSDGIGLGILTTDRTGTDLGYNRWSADKNPKGDQGDVFPNTDYAGDFGSTSSATPLVSGILALGLQANPLMDVHMAKHVLMLTSTRVDPTDASATNGWVKNGAGNWFNRNYGFGLINAGELVNKLKTVRAVTQQTSYNTGTVAVNKPINSFVSGSTNQSFTRTTAQLTTTRKREPILSTGLSKGGPPPRCRAIWE